MILAAGRGERLKPFTDYIPKAMCVVRGAPLIEHHVIKLAQAGFMRLVINHAYLGSQIRQHLGNGARWNIEICYSAEPPGGLETGGGIVNALPLLGTHPFLAVNADIFTDFDYSQLLMQDLSCIHTVLVNKDPHLKHKGDFSISENLLSNSGTDFTFSGIACYNPKIFKYLKPGRFSLTPLIRSYANKGLATAELYQGAWFDIGSLERLQAVRQQR